MSMWPVQKICEWKFQENKGAVSTAIERKTHFKIANKKYILQPIPNGCIDAYEVKVNKDIFKYQEKVKLISQFQCRLKEFCKKS